MTNTTRHHGSRYEETSSLDIAAIAKLVRADIKAAVKAGVLPGKPMAYSVTIERYSMGQSINVRIKHADFPVYEMRDVDGHGYLRPAETVEAATIRIILNQILDDYNYDGSDPMTDYHDVRFYGRAEYDYSTTPQAVDA